MMLSCYRKIVFKLLSGRDMDVLEISSKHLFSLLNGHVIKRVV